jgi:hypothetical protein
MRKLQGGKFSASARGKCYKKHSMHFPPENREDLSYEIQ